MKKLLALLLLAALGSSPALAQPAPQFGITAGYVPKATYSAVFIGLVPAASTTDLFCINGAAAKTIRLQSIRISGSAGTTLSLPVTILRRVTLNTGGTPASTTANPANTISRRDTTQAPPVATLISWTANPTINDTSPTYIDSAQLAISLTTMATVGNIVLFDWAKDTENNLQPPTIRNGQTTQQICANLNSTSLASGLLTGSITWIEE